MNEFVLNGLVKRRAQLAGDIENTHEALRKMVLYLEDISGKDQHGQAKERPTHSWHSHPSLPCEAYR